MEVKTSEALRTKQKRVVTSFEIGNLKEPWEKYCDDKGLSSGAVLGQIVAKLTGAQPSLELQRRWKMTDLKKPDVPYRVVSPGSELEGVINEDDDPEKIAAALKDLNRHKSVYVTFRLSEFDAVCECAKQDGFKKPSNWILTVVRNFLTDQHHLTKAELDALGESNRQLLAIGRNLNQIAKSLNSVKQNSNVIYDRELLENLGVAVRTHVKKVGDLMRISAHRWNLRK